MFWSDVIDLLRALIFGVAHVCNGSVGVAVILVSFAIRLALLPLTLRLARRARETPAAVGRTASPSWNASRSVMRRIRPR